MTSIYTHHTKQMSSHNIIYILYFWISWISSTAGLTRILAWITHKEKNGPTDEVEKEKSHSFKQCIHFLSFSFSNNAKALLARESLSPAGNGSFTWKHVHLPTGCGKLEARPEFPVISERIQVAISPGAKSCLWSTCLFAHLFIHLFLHAGFSVGTLK